MCIYIYILLSDLAVYNCKRSREKGTPSAARVPRVPRSPRSPREWIGCEIWSEISPELIIHRHVAATRWCPPSYKWVIIPLTIDITPINPSYST